MIRYLYVFILMLMISACTNPVPRPRGYFRIDVPEKSYTGLPDIYPYSFEYPSYGKISNYAGISSEVENTSNWLNIDFPDFGAHIYLTYKPVKGNLRDLVEDAHSFVHKHISMADAIEQTEYINPELDVYGLLFDFKGNTATPMQFYLTDSTRNFIRGAFYFDCEPNTDSLAPLIDFFRKDVEYLIESWRWNKLP